MRILTGVLIKWTLPKILTLSCNPPIFLIVGLMYVQWTGAATSAFLAFYRGGD